MGEPFKKFLNFVGWESEDIMNEEIEAADANEVSKPAFLSGAAVRKPVVKEKENHKEKDNRVVSLRQAGRNELAIMRPEHFDDAKAICDYLKDGRSIVVNLESIEKDQAQRVVDFMSGAVYALDGSVEKVANGIFVVVPNNVEILADLKDELAGRPSFSWLK